MANNELVNNVLKVVKTDAGNIITFIIKTVDDTGFWCYQVTDYDLRKYFSKNPADTVSYAMGTITPRMANDFCNDIENAGVGTSWGDFETVEQAINDI